MVSFKKPLVLREYPIPAKIEPGAALVRIKIAGICGTDVHLWNGQLPIPTPVILGHETLGVIEKIGEELEEDWVGNPLKKGDRITWAAGRYCGKCYHCRVLEQPTRCLKRKAYGISFPSEEPPHILGGYSEYIYLLPNTAIFKVPDTLPSETVIGAGCGLATAVHGVERVDVKWGDTVLVQGTGPVGLAALALSKDRGARKIIMVGGPAHRLKIAKRFGADEIIDIERTRNQEERIKKVKKMTDNIGVDVVLECVGIPQAVPEGLEMVRDGGKYLVLGHYGDAGEIPINPHVFTRKQMKLYGSWAYLPRHMWQGIRFLNDRRKQFPFETLITHRFPLEKADQALQTTAKWRSAKTVIEP